jgi:hypothetical protein
VRAKVRIGQIGQPTFEDLLQNGGLSSALSLFTSEVRLCCIGSGFIACSLSGLLD